jgi:8-oxo-dGTP diphosphatase
MTLSDLRAGIGSAWLVRGWRGTPAHLAPEEHLDIGWFGLDDLPPPANADVRSALVEAVGR